MALKEYIVRLKDKSVFNSVMFEVTKWGVTFQHTYRRVFYGFSAQLTDQQIDLLRNDDRVISVEVSTEIRAFTQQSAAPWHLDRIDQRLLPLSGSYTHSSDGTGVIAYVLDSGCVYNGPVSGGAISGFDHSELFGKATPVNKLDGGGTPLASTAFDPIYDREQITDPENSRLSFPRGFDHYGHGTHVAGIIGSTTYGVAKNVDIRFAKIIDVYGSGTFADLIAGFEAIIADFQQNNSTNKPAVCNMSFGAAVVDTPASAEIALQAMIDAGIATVAAAGNGGVDANTIFPANKTNVITVAAADRVVDSAGIVVDNIIADFTTIGDSEKVMADDTFGFANAVSTNTGTIIDVFAPGVGITSTYNTNPFATNTFSGTSMAAAIVTGVVALALENNTGLSPAGAQSLIIANSTINIISNVPAGTPNRYLYSTYVDHAISWITPAGSLGSLNEGILLGTQAAVESTGFTGGPITYSNPGGGMPAGITINAITGILEGTLPVVVSDTAYPFTIRATDSSGYSDRSFSLTVLDNVLPPYWMTSTNLSIIEENEAINMQLLAGSLSTPATNVVYTIIDPVTGSPETLPYSWSLSASGLFTGTAPTIINEDRIIAFTVRATDGAVYSDRTFTITVKQSVYTNPPVWQTAQDLGEIIRWQPVDIQLLATDSDGNPLSVTYSTTVETGGNDLGPFTPLPTGLILDENSGRITDIFTGTLTEGEPIDRTSFDTETTTFDTDTTTLELRRSVFEFQVFATDGAYVVGKWFKLTILDRADNIPPVWSTPSSNLGTIKALSYSTLQVKATDSDGAPRPLTYSIVHGLFPTGMFIDPLTGEIYGIPENIDNKEETFIFGVRVSDYEDFVDRTFSIAVTRINKSPVWVTSAGSLGSTLNIGESFAYQLNAVDPNENDVLTYSVISITITPVGFDNNTTTFDTITTVFSDPVAAASLLPDGVYLNSSTGLLYGAIENITTDTTFTFIIRVDDSASNVGEELYADREFSISATSETLFVNQAPVWTTAAGSLTSGTENVHYYYQLLAEDTDGPQNLKYLLVSGTLPNGLALNVDSGIISGFPNDVDLIDNISTFTISLSDGVLTSDRIFSINIVDTTVDNLDPVWVTESGTLGTYNESTAMVYALNANDPDGDSLTYSDPTNSLPTGLSITTDGVINGITPSVVIDQDFNFNITVDDGNGGVVARSFSISVVDVPNIAPVWSTATDLGTHTEGLLVPISLIATDADSGPLALTYTDTSGSATHLAAAPVGATLTLPPGLSLSSSGVLSGTSVVSGNTTFSFEVTVSDGEASIPEQFLIIVNEAVIGAANSELVVAVTGGFKSEFITWNANSLIRDDEIYQIDDPEFGRATESIIPIMNNIYTTSILTIFNTFGVHHDRFDVLAGVPERAIVRDVDDNIIYEVIYLSIVDFQAGSSFDIIDDYANRSPDPLTLSQKTISKNFDHLRQELDVLANNDTLPDWMLSEQTLGDSTSILGYTPSMIIAYVKPNIGSTVIDRINAIESVTEILPAIITTFDVNVVYGQVFNPVVTIGDDLTITNGTDIPVVVTFTSPGTLSQIALDINNAVIPGVSAVTKNIDIFVPDLPPATWPGEMQSGDVLVIIYDGVTITFSTTGTAVDDLGLFASSTETSWNDNSTFDNDTSTVLTVTKGPGYQLTGRKLGIDRYRFKDNGLDVTEITSFTDASVSTTFDSTAMTFDTVLGTTKWLKFRTDSLNPVWITSKGILGVGLRTLDVVSTQLEVDDVSNTGLTFSLIYGSLPDGLSISTSGLISGTVNIVSSDNVDYYFVVRVVDGGGNYSDRGFTMFADSATTFDSTTTTFTDGTATTFDVV